MIMYQNDLPSKLLADVVEQFSRLPGIGERSAIRMALFLLRQKKENVMEFGNSLIRFIENIRFCKKCHNISDSDLCQICSSKYRDTTTICIVENLKDVISIENTQQYHGLYHVLGGLISPVEGIGPGDLQIESLLSRIGEEQISEIIFALSATLEGDTTCFYISRKFKNSIVKISIIARGVSFGDELEYTDSITLGRSILHRTLFENTGK